MPLRLFKLAAYPFIIFNLLLLSACGSGDRGFVPFSVTEPIEFEAPLSVNAAGVKGPLTNAELSFYSVDLNAGRIGELSSATKMFASLLESVGATFVDGNLVVPVGQEVALRDAFEQSFLSLGFVSELDALRREVSLTNNLVNALSLVDDFLDSGESNGLVIEEVQEIRDSFGSLEDLRIQLNSLDSINEQILESETLSEIRSVIAKYRAREVSSLKLEGWTRFAAFVDLVSQNLSSASGIRTSVLSLIETVENDSALSADLVAVNRLESLEESLAAASSVNEAEDLVLQAHREEGNATIRLALKQVVNDIYSVRDVQAEFEQSKALYHLAVEETPDDDSFTKVLATSADLPQLFEGARNLFAEIFDEAWADALISPDLDEQNEPVNLLAQTQSGSLALRDDINLGDYQGFVFFKSKTLGVTRDVNSGGAPILSVMESIFHSDDIRGFGDNSQEDRRLVFVRNGVEQRDAEGELIQNGNDLDGDVGEFDKILPDRFATPLSSLGMGLVKESVGSFDIWKDVDGDGLIESEINEDLIKEAVQQSSEQIRSAFALGTTYDFDPYISPAVITKGIASSESRQLEVLYFRSAIEYFSSLLVDLAALTNQSEQTMLEALAKDLSDGELDGLYGVDVIAELNTVPSVYFEATKDPSERFVPGTSRRISEVVSMLREQLSQVDASVTVRDFSLDGVALSLESPKGGVDSDEDGVLDNSDQFPQDPSRQRDIAAGYPGLWDVQFDETTSYVLPFDRELTIEFSVFEQEVTCSPAPCASIGDISSVISDTWTVIDGPVGGDLQISEVDDSLTLGFNATASVPGRYSVLGLMATSDTPIQEYRVIISVDVLDPANLELSFNPQLPLAGEAVSVQLKLSESICEALPLGTSVCTGVDFDDTVEDFADVQLIPGIFETNWRLNGESLPNSSGHQGLFFEDAGSRSLDLFRTQFGDELSAHVDFIGRGNRFTAATYDVKIGALNNATPSGQIQDADFDGVPDVADAFPLDGNCHLRSDGFYDTNGDGQESEADSPVCIASLKPASGLSSLVISEVSETIEYSNETPYIYRSDSGSGDNKPPVSTLKVGSDISAVPQTLYDGRLVVGFENGQLWTYDYTTLELEFFADVPNDDWSLPLAVSGIFVAGDLLLVNYGSGRYQIFDSTGAKVELSAQRIYPGEGEFIAVQAGTLDLGSLRDSLEPTWEILRYVGGNSYQLVTNSVSNDPDSSPLRLADQGFSLMPGQTRLGEIVTFKLMSGPDIAYQMSIPVVNFESLDLEQATYEVEDVISLRAGESALRSLSSRTQLADGYEFYVDWLIDGEATAYSKKVLRTSGFPFSLPSSLTEFGDIVTANVILKRDGIEHLVANFWRIVIGDPAVFVADVTITGTGKDLTISTDYTGSNRDFFDRFFSPEWYLSDEIQTGQTDATFPEPTLSDSRIRWGDTIELAFNYENGSSSGKTFKQFVSVVTLTDPSTEVYEIGPRNVRQGDLVSLEFNNLTEESLVGFNANWYVNGVLDSEAQGFDYDTTELSFGDELELRLERTDLNPDDNIPPESFLTSETSKVWIGYEFPNASAESPDEDSDGVRNLEDYFRFDPNCAAADAGNPDDADSDRLSDLAELLSIAPNKSYPNLRDSDGDGYSDFEEINNNTDPLDDSDPSPVANDSDGDGLSDDDERNIYGSKILVSDSDGDGLSDGFEVGSARFDLNDPNTVDPERLDGEIVVAEQEASQTKVPSGSCYVSWLYGEDNLLVDYSKRAQTDDNSAQVVALAKPNGKEVILYDALAEDFLTSLKLSTFSDGPVFGETISAIGFSYSDADDLYIGRSDGKIVEVDTGSPEAILSPLTTNVFESGEDGVVTQVFDQGDVLVVQLSNSLNEHKLMLFDKTPLQTNAPSLSLNLPFEIKHAVWRDPAVRDELWLVSEGSNSGLAYLSLDTVTPSNSTLSSVALPAPDSELRGPFYIRNLTDGNFAFASGQVFDPVAMSWGLEEPRFKQAIEHQGHVVLISEAEPGISILQYPSGQQQTYWSFSRESNIDPLLFVPRGNDVTILGSDTESERLRFVAVEVGDSDADGLPGWWEGFVLGNNLPGDESIDAAALVDGVNTYLQAFNNRLDILGNIYDSDGDGINDEDEDCLPGVPCILLADQDRDGLRDGDELLLGYDPKQADTGATGTRDGERDFDSDGLNNREEIYVYFTDPMLADSDTDGLQDGEEVFVTQTDPNIADSNGNGINDNLEDPDRDSLSNEAEILNGTDPLSADTDGDGASDALEIDVSNNTDPLVADTDGDGIGDFVEISVGGLDPLVDDASLDPDNDNLSNLQEALFGSSPILSDTDSDGLGDEAEFGFGTNPVEADSDGDGWNDLSETLGAAGPNGFDTNPVLFDTDEDGLGDRQETELSPRFNSDPTLKNSDSDQLDDLAEYSYEFVYDANELALFRFAPGKPLVFANPLSEDTDGDGLLDHEELSLGTNIAEADTDNDGLNDLEENLLATSPTVRDSDSDGIVDGDEVNILLTSPLDTDSDDDGISDYDEDSDSDGVSDGDELEKLYTDPTLADGQGRLRNDDGRLVSGRSPNIGAVYYDDIELLVEGGDSIDGSGNLLDDSNIVLLAQGAYIVESANGISDADEDPDRDGLVNSQELVFGTDPYSKDSDGDGVIDGDEVNASDPADNSDPTNNDTDGDELSDGLERQLGTDPNNPDTDGDSLRDGDEVNVKGSDPLDIDSDDDLLTDGLESDAAINNPDADGDGLLDGIEQEYLGTDPNASDTDGDEIPDGIEVWVYAFDDSSNLLTQFHSRQGLGSWAPAEFPQSLADAQPITHDIKDLLDVDGAPLGRLYVRSLSNPLLEDSDNDGLSDSEELISIEANRTSLPVVVSPPSSTTVFGFDFDTDLDTGTFYAPSTLNSVSGSPASGLFDVSDPANSDTDGDGISDGSEDADGDFLVNSLDLPDESILVNTLITRDSDVRAFPPASDGLVDGIELLVLGTNRFERDSDADGLLDNEELVATPSFEELLSGQCAADKIQVDGIAGRNYCFTVEYLSYPTLEDSDFDEVSDSLDSYPLDATCSELADGFVEPDARQCYSSWVAEQDSVEQVRFIDDSGATFNEIALYSEGWDKVVRFNYASAGRGFRDHISDLPLASVIAYSESPRRLYLSTDDGDISFIDPVTYTSGVAPQVLANSVVSAGSVSAMQTAGASIVLEVENAGQTDLYIVSSAGSVGTTVMDTNFDISNGYWDETSSRLYGFLKPVAPATESQIAYIEVNTGTSEFVGGVVAGTADFGVKDPYSRITLSKGEDLVATADDRLLLGSGFLVTRDLSSATPFTLEFSDQSYQNFGSVQDISGHRVASLAINEGDLTSAPGQQENALVANETLGKNVYLLPPISPNEEVLEIAPRGDTDLLFVLRDSKQLTLLDFGIEDQDADGMTGIYEAFYGLDDSVDDRYQDPDQDFLTNLDEFENGTDPLVEDTDQDGWGDGYEVFNGSDPLDADSIFP